jgi:hypothetical protein
MTPGGGLAVRTRSERRTPTGRRRRARLLTGLLAGTVLGGGSLLTTVEPAGADGGVVVPRHLSQATTLGLLGASGAGFAVAQGAGFDTPRSTGRLLTGEPGSELTYEGDDVNGNTAGVSGNTVYWTDQPGNPGQAGTSGWVVHSDDLVTGAKARFESPEEPIAWTPDGWITFDHGTLRRHVAEDGSTSTLLTGIPESSARNGYLTIDVEADSDGAVVDYPVRVAGQMQQRIGLITFGRPGIEVLATTSSSADGTLFLGPTALSPHRVAWVDGGFTESIGYRLRSGGDITTVKSTTTSYGIQDLAATDTQIAITTGFTTRSTDVPATQVWVLTGPTWRRADLPGPPEEPDSVVYGGMATVGSTFFVAVGGSVSTTAGIYEVDTRDDDAAGPIGTNRVATVGPESAAFEQVNLSAGQLSYSDLSDAAFTDYRTKAAVWQRTIQGNGRGLPALDLAAEHGVAVNAGIPDITSAGTVGMWSFSAGRAAAAYWDWTRGFGTLQLVDRGVVRHSLRFDLPPLLPIRVSGPYILFGSARVYRADGKQMASLPEADVVGVDLFGSSVVYSTTRGTIQLLHATWPQSMMRPAVLARTGVCDGARCAGEVAIWGDTVAWTRLDGSIAIRALGRSAVRVVRPEDGPVSGLRMSEGTLSWQTASGGPAAWALDLTTRTSSPVGLGPLTMFSVDDHLVAGVDSDGQLTVSPLPFGLRQPYAPRLIGTLAPSNFNAAGDGWAPEFDVSKPVDSVRLTISRGPTVVQQIAGTGPDGSIRDLRWDGRDTAGLPAAPGEYHWRLTAEAADGDGPLAAADGHSDITGTLTLTG